VIKPYHYIDKLKEEIDKELYETKRKAKEYNDKYMGKIVILEHNVNKVATETDTLVDQYKKKIGDIGKDLSSIKSIRENVESKVNGC
jgi:predicted  nucleic acid-binding Zn-ribbon protein